MKIGILTYHAVYNFGANLQALSTYSYLRNMGHTPIMIDFFPKVLEESFDRSVPKKQANDHKKYIQNHFTLTKRCRNAKEIASAIEKNAMDAIIIGSDAVVQHYPLLARLRINPSRRKILSLRIEPIRYETNYPNPFWGEFIKYLKQKIPVAMMSVSCQNTDYKLIIGQEKKRINEIISLFRYISVRDKRTQQLFNHISNSAMLPKVTPDPVFAFNDNVQNLATKDEIKAKYSLPDNYILLSFNSPKTVSKTWLSTFDAIAKENGYQCVALAMPGGIRFQNSLSHKIDIPLDPLDWYNIIKYSSAYVGEKMHPIIVALHNCVPFFSFDHYGSMRLGLFHNQEASKIYQILERANMIEYRICISKKIKYNPPSPEYVLEKLKAFEKEKCALFALQMRNEYKNMMTELISKL